MTIFKLVTLSVAALSLAAPTFAADTYTLDPSHTEVGFAVKHMVISTVKGKFTGFEGTIVHDPEDISRSSVEVTIDAASIDTNNDRRDEHLRSADFFEAEKFPHITFKSTSVAPRGAGLVARGPLTIRGVTREVELPFTITGVVKDPWGNTRIGVEVEPLTIDRTEFGLTWNKALEAGGVVVSDEVVIDLSVQAIRE